LAQVPVSPEANSRVCVFCTRNSIAATRTNRSFCPLTTMASLWNALRSEVMGTVDDFRQKGAIGAFRDAALDTLDMAKDASNLIVDSVQGLVTGEEEEPQAFVRSASTPVRGSTVSVEFSDGKVVDAVVVDVDGVSDPPRVRVTIPGQDAPLLVPVISPESELASATAQRGTPAEGDGSVSLLTGIKQEWNQTVQEFREKGAVGAMKDAALDAVDIVGSTASSAVNGAKTLASPLIDLEWTSGNTEGQPAADADAESAAPRAAFDAASVPGGATAMNLLDGLKQEIQGTVQDFREKGAVGAMKDAALDAVDIVKSTTTTAVSGAKTLAQPILENNPLPDLWASVSSPTDDAPNAAAPAVSDPVVLAPTQAASSSSSSSQGPTFTAPEPVGPPASAEPPSPPAAKVSAPPSPPASAQDVEKAPAVASDSSMPESKPGRKSLVSMRRNMFEKPKDDADVAKQKESEELID